MEDHRRRVLLEHLAHARGVLAVDQHRRRPREVALLLELAADLEQRVLRVVDQHQQLRPDPGDLAAQLGADRAARAGHEHDPAGQVGAHAVDLHADRLAAEHVLHLDLAHLAHQVRAAGQQLERGRQHAHRDRALAAGGDHALAQDARRRRDGDDHLVGLDRVEHARQLVGRAEHLVARPRACPACAGRRPRTRPARCAGRGCGAARRRPAGRRCRRPTISTSWPARSSIAPRAGRSNAQRTAKRAPQTNTSASRKSIAITRARRVVAADREQEQHDDQPAGRDDRRLEDRLEVLLVDEAPELRVEAERRVDRDLHRHGDPDRVGEQVLVAVRDPLVEAQHVRQPVGEREQGRVHADLADAADVH